jgi:hypothetical protein
MTAVPIGTGHEKQEARASEQIHASRHAQDLVAAALMALASPMYLMLRAHTCPSVVAARALI